MIYDLIPTHTSVEQTQKFNEMFGADESYYTIGEIYNLFPKHIKTKQGTGLLQMSTIDVSYTSLSSDFKLNLINVINVMPSMDIFDAFIATGEWLMSEDSVEVLDPNFNNWIKS